MCIKYLGIFMDTFTFDASGMCVLLVTLIVTLSVLKTVTVSKRKIHPPGPWCVPIFGHLPFIGTQPIQTFAKWQQKYGNVFKVKLGNWDTVVINGYSTIKEAADKPDDDFSSRPKYFSMQLVTDTYGSETLSFAPFCQEYIQHKKFTKSALRMFINRPGNVTERTILQEAMALVTSLLSKDYTQPRNIKSEIQYATASIIYQILYGHGKQPTVVQKELRVMIDTCNAFSALLENGNPLDVLPWLRYIMPWKVKQLKTILETSVGLHQEQVEEHIEISAKDDIQDITDALLASDIGELGDDDNSIRPLGSRVVATLNDLQAAGFDTTHKSLMWMMLYMAKYPEIQQVVQKEIDDVIGSGRSVQLKDRKNLPYTDATIHEVMRITTIAPFALPKYTTKDTSLAGYDIDKGTVVFFNIHSISHEKEFWIDPENFRPSRLITENNELDITKCNRILPFGVGRRRCVGENLAKIQLFLVFATVMQRCSIIKPDGCELDLDPVPLLVYSPKDFTVIVKER